jgi:hypothetical protein
MRVVVLLLLFIGALMIVDGVYDQRMKEYKQNVRVEYRFIPRTYYEEQLYNSDLNLKMKDMFNKDQPWYGRDTLELDAAPAVGRKAAGP